MSARTILNPPSINALNAILSADAQDANPSNLFCANLEANDNVVGNDLACTATLTVGTNATVTGFVKCAGLKDSTGSTGTNGQIPTADGNGGWVWATPA